MLAVASGMGVQSEIIPRIATGLTAGISHSGEMCGAVIGGIMGISLAHGRNQASQSVDACFGHVQVFMHNFNNRFGSTSCLKLSGCHLGTPEGQAYFREHNAHDRCLEFVREATRLCLEQVIIGS